MVEIAAAVSIAIFHGIAFTTSIGLDVIHRSEQQAAKEHARDPMVGKIQKMPLVRECKEQALPGEVLQEISNHDWKTVPHIHDICHYAKHGHGCVSYYWTKSLARLNRMYIDWVHSIPADSPIHQKGDYIPIFFQLHIKHFENGLRGYMRDTFSS